MSNVIRTVLGDIDPELSGPANMHDHLIRDDGTVEVLMDKDFLMDDPEVAIEELHDFVKYGGRTFLDAQPLGCGRNIEKYIQIAKQIPEVQIVASTGFHKGGFYLKSHWVNNYSINEMVDLILGEIYEGFEIDMYNGPFIKRSTAKAGAIKAGTSYQVITPLEKKMCTVSARAQIETGMLLFTHTQRGTMGNEQLDIFESEGVDLSRVMIGHIDRNPDPDYLISIAKRGATLEFDTPMRIKYHSENFTIDCLKALINAGYEDQIVFAGDNGRRSYLKAYGGGPGYAYILEKFIPRLYREGFSEEVIQKIMVFTPRRLLSFERK